MNLDSEETRTRKCRVSREKTQEEWMEHFVDTVDGLASRLNWDEDQRQEGMLAAFEVIRKTDDFSDYSKVYRAVYNAAKYAVLHGSELEDRRQKEEAALQERAEEIEFNAREQQRARVYIGVLLQYAEKLQQCGMLNAEKALAPEYLLSLSNSISKGEMYRISGYSRNHAQRKELDCVRKLRRLVCFIDRPWQYDRLELFMHCEGTFREIVAVVEPTIWRMREGK